MKANRSLEPGLVDNASKFTDPFFERFQLQPAPAPLELKEGLSKTYSFPTFYSDVTCAIAIFMCDYRCAEALMPEASMKPVRMPMGRSVVLFACYEYKNVLNLAPYNEIAMIIPVIVGGGFHPPILPLVMNLRNKGYHVFSMPVTSLENQIRGTSLWGLPKIVEEIDIATVGTHCTTRAMERRGDVYFELSVPKSGHRKHIEETGFLYSVRNGKLLKSPTSFCGDFNINTNFRVLLKKAERTDAPALKLGRSSEADILRGLRIEDTAFQFRFAERMNSCFDLPLDTW
jgi:hypothetical protein